MADKIVGNVKLLPLAGVKPNEWNPNKMKPHMEASLTHGLREDGWLVSQALLVWGKDEKGKARNVIIDGEHRWDCATKLGFKKGPMVVLDGITKAQAQALTIKLNQKRGEFDEASLSTLLNELQGTLEVPDLGLELGFDDEKLLGVLAYNTADVLSGDEEAGEAAAGNGAGLGEGPPRTASNHTRLVQLFFDAEQHSEWQEAIRVLAKHYEKDNVSESALEAVRRAAQALGGGKSTPPQAQKKGDGKRAAGHPA